MIQPHSRTDRGNETRTRLAFTAQALLLLTAGTFAAEPLAIAEVKRETPVDFAKDVHPIFKRSCLACHNTTKAKAGLNLESPQSILKGGDSGPAALKGKGLESLLVRSAAHQEDSAMPPPGNKVNAPDLTPEELGLLKLWIDQGLNGTAVSDNVADWRGFPSQHLSVSATALSASGRIAAAARGNQIHLTEVPTGISLGLLTDPELAKLDLYKDKSAADRDAVMSVAFGGDDLMATGGFRTVRLWRRAPLSEKRPAIDLPATATCLAASTQRCAAGDASGLIRVWDPSLEKPVLQEWNDHTTAVKALSFTPDGLLLVSAAADRSFRVWDAATQAVVFRSESPAEITACCFLKGGTELAISSIDGMLRVFPFTNEIPAAPPTALREWKLADQPATSLATLDPAGTQVLWINQEPILHLTETADGKRIADLPLENPVQFSISDSQRRLQALQKQLDTRKARLAAAVEAVKKESENLRTTHQNQEKTRADWQRKLELARIAEDVSRSAPEDKPRKEAATKATTDAKAAERAFTDARTNAELSVRLTGQAQQFQSASEGAAAAAETAVAEATVTLESLKKSLSPLTAPKSLQLINDGKVALVTMNDARLQWHSSATGEFLDAAEGVTIGSGPMLLAANPTGLFVARADKKVANLPLRRHFALERTLGKPEDATVFSNRVTALSFSSDARLLATGGGVPSRSGEAKIWNTSDGTAVLTIPDPHSDTINALSFSPDDSLLATAGSDRWARVFSTNDARQIAAFEGHSGQVLSISWRSDGLALATGGADKTLRFWDLLDNKQTRIITTFGKEVSAVSWLGTTDTVASASGDATIRLNEEALPGNKGFCYTLASDPAGKFLTAGGEDGILRIWLTAGKKLLREIP